MALNKPIKVMYTKSEHFLTLFRMSPNKPQTTKEIAALSHSSIRSVQRHLDRLVQSGYLKKDKDPNSARGFLYSLTPDEQPKEDIDKRKGGRAPFKNDTFVWPFRDNPRSTFKTAVFDMFTARETKPELYKTTNEYAKEGIRFMVMSCIFHRYLFGKDYRDKDDIIYDAKVQENIRNTYRKHINLLRRTADMYEEITDNDIYWTPDIVKIMPSAEEISDFVNKGKRSD